MQVEERLSFQEISKKIKNKKKIVMPAYQVDLYQGQLIVLIF